MQLATEAYFRGLWTLERRIEAPGGATTGRFSGTAEFVPEGGGLMRCREAGRLAHAGGSFAADRVTLWRIGPEGIAVAFADGRPFHAFTVAAPEAVHLCGADRYAVRYDFAPDGWTSVWRVTGPAKDYVMRSDYRRASGAPG